MANKITFSNKILMLLLTMVLIIWAIPFTALNINAADTGEFSGGTGSESEPYIIATAEDLVKLSSDISTYGGAYFKQTDNIEVENFAPIGESMSNAFSGTYDGSNYTISGTIGDSRSDFQGFFGCTSSSATIKNVTVSATVIGENFVGGVVGYNEGTVENCVNTGEVSGSGKVGGIAGYSEGTVTASYNTGNVGVIEGVMSAHIGGVVGYNEGNIISSYNTGTVTATATRGYNVGGVAGYSDGGKIEYSYNEGDVSGQSEMGGIVGYNDGGTIAFSYNTGNVEGVGSQIGGITGCNNSGGTIISSYNQGETVKGESLVGGILGYNQNGTITDAYNTADVSGTDNVGGIAGAGWNGATIENTYNTGDISGETNIGGIIGRNYSTVTSSYNTGNITGEEKVGGVVGYCYNNGDTDTVVTNCYNQGDVNGDMYVGGVVGHANKGVISYVYNTGSVTTPYGDGQAIASNDGKTAPTITYAYYDNSTSSTSNSKITGFTTTEMTGTGEDRGDKNMEFSADIWGFITDNGETQYYPILLSNPQYVTVNFVDGETYIDYQIVEINTTATTPVELTKTDYIFDAWYSDEDLENKFDFKTPVKENMTLYAGWIFYESEFVLEEREYIYGSNQSLTFKIDRDYYKFEGLTLNESEIEKENYTSEEGSTIVTLSADYLSTFSPGNYEIKVNFTDSTAILKLSIVSLATATPTATVVPTVTPTVVPTATPTVVPTATPTVVPTATPTVVPTIEPTVTPDEETTETPETGDSGTFPVAVLMMVAMVGMVGMTIILKNKKQIIK